MKKKEITLDEFNKMLDKAVKSKDADVVDIIRQCKQECSDCSSLAKRCDDTLSRVSKDASVYNITEVYKQLNESALKLSRALEILRHNS